MKTTNIAILAGEGDSTTFMYNSLKNDFCITNVIIEEPVSKKKLISRRIKKLGFFKVLGQIFFMLYNVFLNKKSVNRINAIRRHEGLCDDSIKEELVTRVTSINSAEVLELLKEIDVEVIVVNGTRIISTKILESTNVPFINTHSGITPKYRGVHGGYWALTANDRDNCGVTVHLVDKGIDTGGILYQGIINVTEEDNFNSYPYLQIALAIPLMKRAIKDVSNGSVKIKQLNLPSKLWSHPTIFEYLFYKIKHKVK
jgi:folate-dependent phosphoribosylglycinamide formyltransferase PurN